MAALAVVTMIGFWEWTQFVEAKSRYLALVPAAILFAVSAFLVPFDAYSLNEISLPHLTLLGLGCAWWLLASVLAITYPKSATLWQGSTLLRHLFRNLNAIALFLERSDAACAGPL